MSYLKVQKRKEKIHKLALKLIDRHHGEIFEEFYDLGCSQKTNIKTFSKEVLDWLKETLKEEGSDKWVQIVYDLLDKGLYGEGLLEYFKENKSHGEYAGMAFAACFRDANFTLAQRIYLVLHEQGFDS